MAFERFHRVLDKDVELRLLEEIDVEALYQLTDRNRDHLRRWLPWIDEVQSSLDTGRFVQSTLLQAAQNNGFHAGIWYRGRLSGVVGFHGIDWVNRSTTLGYWLDESCQGRGVVTAACREVVDWAFRRWRLNRVEIRCAVENERSWAIPERLGFTCEGTARQAQRLHDRYADLKIYAVLAREWNGTIGARHRK